MLGGHVQNGPPPQDDTQATPSATPVLGTGGLSGPGGREVLRPRPLGSAFSGSGSSGGRRGWRRHRANRGGWRSTLLPDSGWRWGLHLGSPGCLQLHVLLRACAVLAKQQQPAGEEQTSSTRPACIPRYALLLPQIHT